MGLKADYGPWDIAEPWKVTVASRDRILKAVPQGYLWWLLWQYDKTGPTRTKCIHHALERGAGVYCTTCTLHTRRRPRKWDFESEPLFKEREGEETSLKDSDAREREGRLKEPRLYALYELCDSRAFRREYTKLETER